VSKEQLKLRQLRISALRVALEQTNQRIEAKRCIMLQELGEVFPIGVLHISSRPTLEAWSNHGTVCDVSFTLRAGISSKTVTICSLPLPVSLSFKDDDSQHIAATCVMAQVLPFILF
jgi:hypothetical protein